MSLNMLARFRAGVTALWATTYTFEPTLFDNVFFRQLGDAPLNVNILVDAQRIAWLWDKWADQPWRFRRLNRDYLVRSVPWGGNAFHPKTYLLADRSGGVLLVGSGNLGWRGLIEGNEVFCEFSSTTEIGRAAIVTWREWMERIVANLGDLALARRWQDLLRTAPWLTQPAGPSPFIHNLDRPIIDALIDAMPETVDELHVLAPFYDASARALATLLECSRPRRLYLYLPDRVSVTGERLHEVIRAAPCPAELLGFEKPHFVHAKLIGLVSGERGVILSGSPNCSAAALLHAGQSGNCEVAIIGATSAEKVRAAFLPPGWATVRRDEAFLLTLDFQSSPELSIGGPVTLASASWRDDRRIGVVYHPHDSQLVARIAGHRLDAALSESVTIEPVSGEDHVGVVWLCDRDGQRVSNAVPLDDPKKLVSWLAERAPVSDRPAELRPEDGDTDVGNLLRRLNRECIFDIDEAMRATGAIRAVEDDGDSVVEGDSAGFWERYQATQLQMDDRVTRYGRLLRSEGWVTWFEEDEIYALLGSMLSRVPDHQLQTVVGAEASKARPSHPTHPRLQVRVGNVLARWSRALNDRRFSWLAPHTPVKNYIALLFAIAESWTNGYVGQDRLRAITLSLLQGFVGSEKRPGYLLQLDEEDRGTAVAALGPDAPQVAAALFFVCLHPRSAWKSQVFEWQPSLVPAVEAGILSSGPLAVEYVQTLIGAQDHPERRVNARAIEDHLLRLCIYMDDHHWCRLQVEELGLHRLSLESTGGDRGRQFPITLRIDGVPNLLVEPRLVTLVRRLVAYRQVPGLIVETTASSGGRPSRLTVQLSGRVFGTGGWESTREIEIDDLRRLEEQGRGFEGLNERALVPDRRTG